MAAVAAKVAFEALKFGADKVPDKYWDNIPGLRDRKSGDATSKNGKHEHGRGRHANDGKGYGSDAHDAGHRRRRDERPHGRRRSASDERRGNEPRRDREARAERRRLERRASSYSPYQSDEEFYNDAARRRQERRQQKYFCNDPVHKQWEQMNGAAAASAPATGPYSPMPQAGAPPSFQAQTGPTKPGNNGNMSPYNPAVYPPSPYTQPAARPPQNAAPAYYQGSPNPSYNSTAPTAQYQGAPSAPYPDQHNTYSGQQNQPSPPYGVQAPLPRAPLPTQSMRTPQPQAAFPPPPPPPAGGHPQAHSTLRVPTPGLAPSPASSAASTASNGSKAAQKYTPPGTATMG